MEGLDHRWELIEPTFLYFFEKKSRLLGNPAKLQWYTWSLEKRSTRVWLYFFICAPIVCPSISPQPGRDRSKIAFCCIFSLQNLVPQFSDCLPSCFFDNRDWCFCILLKLFCLKPFHFHFPSLVVGFFTSLPYYSRLPLFHQFPHCSPMRYSFATCYRFFFILLFIFSLLTVAGGKGLVRAWESPRLLGLIRIPLSANGYVELPLPVDSDSLLFTFDRDMIWCNNDNNIII